MRRATNTLRDSIDIEQGSMVLNDLVGAQVYQHTGITASNDPITWTYVTGDGDFYAQPSTLSVPSVYRRVTRYTLDDIFNYFSGFNGVLMNKEAYIDKLNEDCNYYNKQCLLLKDAIEENEPLDY